MTIPLTIECTVDFRRRRRRRLCALRTRSSQSVGRVPRVAQFMALAIHFDGLVRAGRIADYAELARLGQVSRARVSQIMSLLHLAPDIQEQILFLVRKPPGREPIHLAQLQPITQEWDWRKQRRLWHGLVATLGNTLDNSQQLP